MPKLISKERCLFLRRKDPLHFFLIIILLFSGAGCATFTGVRGRIDREEIKGRYLEQVPFVKQKRNWCGPAALTSILNYWREGISQEEVAAAVYRRSIRSTLTLDMVSFAEARGLWAEMKTGDIRDIGYFLEREIPVIVLIQPYPIIKKYHYLVVAGVSEEEEVIIAHTGRRANKLLSFRHLRSVWQGGSNIMIIVSPPGKVDWELDGPGYNRLGLVFEKKGIFDKAILNYKAALEEKERAEPHFNLANVYLKKGEIDKATGHYEKAIAIRPDFADAYNNLAYFYREEKPREAERLAGRAIELGGENLAYYWDTLGEIQLIGGKIEEAKESFLKAQEIALENDAALASIIQKHLSDADKLLTEK